MGRGDIGISDATSEHVSERFRLVQGAAPGDQSGALQEHSVSNNGVHGTCGIRVVAGGIEAQDLRRKRAELVLRPLPIVSQGGMRALLCKHPAFVHVAPNEHLHISDPARVKNFTRLLGKDVAVDYW